MGLRASRKFIRHAGAISSIRRGLRCAAPLHGSTCHSPPLNGILCRQLQPLNSLREPFKHQSRCAPCKFVTQKLSRGRFRGPLDDGVSLALTFAWRICSWIDTLSRLLVVESETASLSGLLVASIIATGVDIVSQHRGARKEALKSSELRSCVCRRGNDLYMPRTANSMFHSERR